MRYVFPDYNPEPEFVQPDYEKWKLVTEGMSSKDLIDLLGPPWMPKIFANKTNTWLKFGYLEMPMNPIRHTYSFDVFIDEFGKVGLKSDPFLGNLSLGGTPTKPEFIIPIDHTTFSHYPRVVDLRWSPCSGHYPMTYTIEGGMGIPGEPTQYSENRVITNDHPFPYFVINHCGAQPGRFRVKAQNELGESEWSEYRHFTFTI